MDSEFERQFAFTVSEREYWRFIRYSLLHGTKNRWAWLLLRYTAIIAYIVTLGWLLNNFQSRDAHILEWTLPTFIVVATMLHTFNEWCAPLARARNFPGTLEPITVTVTSQYVEVEDVVYRARRIAWSAYTRAVIADGLVILFLTPRTATLIPVREFSIRADATEFVERTQQYRDAKPQIIETVHQQTDKRGKPIKLVSIRGKLAAPARDYETGTATRYAYYALPKSFAIEVAFSQFWWTSIFVAALYLLVVVMYLPVYRDVPSTLKSTGPVFAFCIGLAAIISLAKWDKRKGQELRAPSQLNEIVTDYNVLQWTTPTVATTYRVPRMVWATHIFKKVLIKPDPIESIIAPEDCFGSHQQATEFATRLQANMTEGRKPRKAKRKIV